jgi:hypothetical protein
MTTLRQAAQEALAWIHYHRRAYAIDEPIEERNLRKALAQQEKPLTEEEIEVHIGYRLPPHSMRLLLEIVNGTKGGRIAKAESEGKQNV